MNLRLFEKLFDTNTVLKRIDFLQLSNYLHLSRINLLNVIIVRQYNWIWLSSNKVDGDSSDENC